MSFPYCFLHAEDVTETRINLALVRVFYPSGDKSITFEFDVDYEVDLDYPSKEERDAAFQRLVDGIG